MTNRASTHRPAITNQVRHDQRSREEDLAKNEVAEKVVPFAAGDTAGQKAMAVQMTADRIDQSHQPVPTSRPPCLGCPSRSLVSDYSVLSAMRAPGPPSIGSGASRQRTTDTPSTPMVERHRRASHHPTRVMGEPA